MTTQQEGIELLEIQDTVSELKRLSPESIQDIAGDIEISDTTNLFKMAEKLRDLDNTCVAEENGVIVRDRMGIVDYLTDVLIHIPTSDLKEIVNTHFGHDGSVQVVDDDDYVLVDRNYHRY